MNKTFNLYGISLDIPSGKAVTNEITIVFDRIANDWVSKTKANFYQKFNDLDDLYARVDILVTQVCSESIDESLKLLAAHGIYHVNEQQFFENHMQKYISWDEDFHEIASTYENILEKTAELDAHRTARRLNRRQWVGYGTKQAVYEADGKNLVSNVGHGVFNLMAKGMTAIGDAIKKGEIFKNPNTVACVANGLGNVSIAAREAVIEAINAHTPGAAYKYSKDEIQKSNAIVDNIKKARIPADHLLDTLVEAIKAYPYNRDIYILLLQNFGGDHSRLDSLIQYFGLKDIEAEKKRILNSRLNSLDLSSLQKIDAQLPGLKLFAQELGYIAFEKEAEKLRQAVSKKEFQARLNSFNFATHSEVVSKTDLLSAFAKEIDFVDYQTEIDKISNNLIEKDFITESAKFSLNSIEEFDRHFPMLKAHAIKIGFAGFPEWSNRVRVEAKANDARRLEEAKLQEKELKRAKNKSLAIFVYSIIAIVWLGAEYGGYLFDKLRSISASRNHSVESPFAFRQQPAPQIPQAMAATEPKESQEANQNANTMELKESERRELTAEEDIAIRDGFVEITDPEVEVCIERRIDAFRASAGQDAPVTYAQHNEWALECGWKLAQTKNSN